MCTNWLWNENGAGNVCVCGGGARCFALPPAAETTGNASCQTININDTLFPSSIETLGIQLFVYGCNSSLEEDLCRALES